MATIIVVDDDAITRQVITMYLSQGGHSVVTANNGIDCLLKLDEQKLDLAIVDVFMPEMGGIDLVPAIRSRFPSIKIIGLSSKTGARHLGAMLQSGANEVAHKPIEASTLLRLVDSVLQW